MDETQDRGDGDGDCDGSAEGKMEGTRVVSCERCPELCASRSRIVNGVGPTDADLCFVGEAPGAQEDAEGEPFVGRSGGVLDDVLRDVGLARADVRITNCVRCRPPDNRDPRADELEHCREYLAAELAAIAPEVLVTLGKVPAEHVLGRDVAITAEAGDVVETRIGGRPQRVLLSVHPAATLYDRSQREPFAETIERAAALAGEAVGDQSRLGEF